MRAPTKRLVHQCWPPRTARCRKLSLIPPKEDPKVPESSSRFNRPMISIHPPMRLFTLSSARRNVNASPTSSASRVLHSSMRFPSTRPLSAPRALHRSQFPCKCPWITTTAMQSRYKWVFIPMNMPRCSRLQMSPASGGCLHTRMNLCLGHPNESPAHQCMQRNHPAYPRRPIRRTCSLCPQ